MPQYSITPGGVEAEGAHLVVPLDAVDGQLPLGGGGGDVAGQGGDQAQGAHCQDGAGDGQVSFAEQKQLHHDPVLSLGNPMRLGKSPCKTQRKRTGLMISIRESDKIELRNGSIAGIIRSKNRP